MRFSFVLLIVIFVSNPGHAFEFQGLEGKPNAISSLVSVPQKTLLEILPQGLILRPQALSPAGQHPVILFTGYQEGLKATGTSLTFPTYLEYILAIPFVDIKSAPQSYPRMYLATLYLNSSAAVWAGRFFYGMPKHLMRIEWEKDFVVNSLISNRTLVQASYKWLVHWNPEDFQKNLKIIDSLYRQPIVQIRNGDFICASSSWHFDTAKAEPVEAKIVMATRNENFHFSVSGLNETPFGAFHFSTHWELEAAHSCMPGSAYRPPALLQ